MINYKGDPIPKFDNLQKELDAIVNRVQDKLDNGHYINVAVLTENSCDRVYLKENIQSITGETPNRKSNKNVTNDNDYQGLYIFCKKENDHIEPQYVGMSRRIISRMKGHVYRASKNSATWVYQMIKTENQELSNEDAQSMIESYRKEKFKNMVVTFDIINEPYLMHIAEAYLAAELKTYWNSFKTH